MPIEKDNAANTLLGLVNLLNPELLDKVLLSSTITAAEGEKRSKLDREEVSLDEMPSDEEVSESLGEEDDVESEESLETDSESIGSDENLEEGIDEDDLGDTGTEELEETEGQPQERITAYDLAFHLRIVSSAFTQVVKEADKLKDITEKISTEMGTEDKAHWIEQRRFFIETAKEAEKKWGDFKKALINFSLTPRL